MATHRTMINAVIGTRTMFPWVESDRIAAAAHTMRKATSTRVGEMEVRVTGGETYSSAMGKSMREMFLRYTKATFSPQMDSLPCTAHEGSFIA